MVLFLIAQLLYMRYRSKSEIFGRVLAVANGQGVTRTGIMYKAFLSFTQAKAILTTLIERELLQFDRTTNTFKITPRGHKVLRAYTELNELMKGLQANKEEDRYAESQVN